jgi:O-antigen/teichoic acid export membrane protein
MREIASLYKKTSINQMIVGLLIFIGIWMSIDDVLTFVPEKYQGIQMVFFYVGLAKLIDVSAGVNGTIIATSDKYRFDLYINLILILVTVVTNVIFIPRYGIEGAAMATAIAILIHNVVKTLVLYSFYKIQPFQRATLKLLAIALVTFFIVEFISFDGIQVVWLRILLRSLLTSLLFSLAVLGLSISEDVNALFKKYIRFYK